MKKKLKKQLSVSRIFMIAFAVLAIIALFNNFAICVICVFLSNLLRLAAKHFQSEIMLVDLLAKYPELYDVFSKDFVKKYME